MTMGLSTTSETSHRHAKEAVARDALAQGPVRSSSAPVQTVGSRPPLYTPAQRVRRDASVWTLVQGLLAPVQFLVFLISLALVMRFLWTGEGQSVATVSVVVKTLALYTIKDSSISGIFVIFICSVWPMLINTAFGVAAVKREWLNVASTLEVSPLRKAFQVILPAAAPTIFTGMRISMGIAWLVIVAVEMLTGGVGIGFFVWDEWSRLNLSSVFLAVFVIGLTGLLLDAAVGKIQELVTHRPIESH